MRELLAELEQQIPAVRQNILREDATIRKMLSEIEGKPAGTTYLLRKRIEQVCLIRTEEETQRLIKTVETEIETFTIKRFPHKTIRITDEDKQIILNVSYLVTNDRVNNLIKHVEEINNRYGNSGLRCTLSGPWPPYGFAGWLIEIETITHRETPVLA
jgi:hypothetical protein